MVITILDDIIPTEGRNLTESEVRQLNDIGILAKVSWFVKQRDGSKKRGILYNTDLRFDSQIPYNVEC